MTCVYRRHAQARRLALTCLALLGCLGFDYVGLQRPATAGAAVALAYFLRALSTPF